MIRPGPLNLITDVPGILVGNAEDARIITGTTVVLGETPAVGACDIRGGAPGTRETDALDPTCLVDAIDGVVLSGGSVYGLDAAGAVVEALGAAGRGFAIPGSPRKAPVVPAAILFDLNNGGDKAWVDAPYRDLGRKAFANAQRNFVLGNSGAGMGARVGDLKGGLGSASAQNEEGLVVGAIVAINAVGSALIPGTQSLWAGIFEQNGEMGGQAMPVQPIGLGWPAEAKAPANAVPGSNTAIAVIATNAALGKAEAKRIAIMAQDGFARSLRPVHTPMDGDSLFVLATGRKALDAERRPLALAMLGMMAADCLARAVGRGVYEAASIGGMMCYRDRLRSGQT